MGIAETGRNLLQEAELQSNKGDFKVSKVLESPRSWSIGVMEYWSVEKKKDINPITITPTLQYSNTPKLVEVERFQDRLPSMGLKRCKKQSGPIRPDRLF